MIEKNHIVAGMILGLVTMLLMAVFIVIFIVLYQRRQIAQEKELGSFQRRHQKDLLETALDSEEAERRRMAEELHDDIGVMLSLTKMSINQLQQKIRGEDEQAMVGRIKELLDETMNNVRRISKALVPSTLEQFGLEAAIEDLVGKLTPSGTPQVIFPEAAEAIPRQSPKVELAIFRIVQELLNNAIKHANATVIKIELYSANSTIQLVVQDNGKGFDAGSITSSKPKGIGLKNIESRLSIINGVATYESANPGVRVSVEIPLSASTS